MVGAQDLFLALRIIGGAARVFYKGTIASAATITLLAFSGISVSDGIGATAVAAIGNLGYFVFYHGPQGTLTTSIEPLPKSYP